MCLLNIFKYLLGVDEDLSLKALENLRLNSYETSVATENVQRLHDVFDSLCASEVPQRGDVDLFQKELQDTFEYYTIEDWLTFPCSDEHEVICEAIWEGLHDSLSQASIPILLKCYDRISRLLVVLNLLSSKHSSCD